MEDPKVYELLSLLVDEMRENRKEMRENLKDVRESIARLERGQEKTTQAVVSLTSLLQKAVIAPTTHLAEEVAELKRRVEALENAQ